MDRTGTIIKAAIGDEHSISKKFACLPTDVTISKDGSSVKLMSYINGIEPHFATMYQALENFLSHTIPLFENVLTDLHRNNPIRQRITGTYRYAEWDEPDPPEDSDDEEGWELYNQQMTQWEATRPIVLPDVPDQGYGHDLPVRKHRVSLRGRNVQIILKIVDVTLVRPSIRISIDMALTSSGLWASPTPHGYVLAC